MRNSVLGLTLFCCVTATALNQLGVSRRLCGFNSRSAECVAQRNSDDAAHRIDHRAEAKRLAQERREAAQREDRGGARMEEAMGSRQRDFVPNRGEPAGGAALRSRARG